MREEGKEKGKEGIRRLGGEKEEEKEIRNHERRGGEKEREREGKKDNEGMRIRKERD